LLENGTPNNNNNSQLFTLDKEKKKIQKNPTFRYFFFRRLLISVGWLAELVKENDDSKNGNTAHY